MSSTGPSIRAVCKILNASNCGSGSIVGIRNGRALIMTNAHVAGTRIGRVVRVIVEKTGADLHGKVIRAAYSTQTSTDWAIIETVTPYTEIAPVPLSKNLPSSFSQSHYTKGFPGCNAHAGTDIRTVNFHNWNIWEWAPRAISGQSGSGVWSDANNLQYGLLTWKNNVNGLGQYSAVIYNQIRGRTTVAAPRIPGLVEVASLPPDYPPQEAGDESDEQGGGLDDPVVEDGYYDESLSRMNLESMDIGAGELDQISDELPIWDDGGAGAEAGIQDPQGNLQNLLVEYQRELSELHERWRNRFLRGK